MLGTKISDRGLAFSGPEVHFAFFFSPIYPILFSGLRNDNVKELKKRGGSVFMFQKINHNKNKNRRKNPT